MLTPDLIAQIREQFRLDWDGIHGAPHWARVHKHGLYLCEATAADTRVVELFAFLHDSQRRNDDRDPGHGDRAAEYAVRLRGEGVFELDDLAMALLVAACQGHSDGRMDGEVTVQVCWDADRLDLGRVGKYPDARRLATWAAKDEEYIEQAVEWSQGSARRF